MTPAETIARLERISYAAYRGQSYSQTKARLDRLGDLIEPDRPELAPRIRALVGRKGLSLGNRVHLIDALVRELRDEEAPDGY